MELNLTVWKRGSQRAVHKPLLLLYALSKYQKGHDRFFSYEEIDEPFKKLLIEFGPYRQTYHTEYAFCRLENDGFWELKNFEVVRPRSTKKDAKKTDLLEYNVSGGFKQVAFDTLLQNKDKMDQVIGGILDDFFPSTVHGDIVETLDIEQYIFKCRKRDPNFRHRVLTAYGYKCAICGFDCPPYVTIVAP